jgi:hypothetical protein
MNRCWLLLLTIVLLVSCRSKEGPDVSGIKVELTTFRFEKEFFSLDTNNLSSSLDALYGKYPVFFRDFAVNILGLPPMNDSGAQTMMAIKRFIRDYRPVYDSVMKVFPTFDRYEEDIVDGMRYVKHYFPQYSLPTKVFTFVGPMDAFFEASTAGYGDVITTEGLAVGLQLHLGANFSMYQSEMGIALYPTYISRRFAPEYIPVNCLKNIVDDMFPDRSAELTLIEQMVEKGKRIYLLDRLMPETPDTLKIGYTKAQLDGCYKNEGFIWNYFVKNNLVYNNDPSLIKNYIGEAPSTQEFGEGAPGYIGMFVGWQIVKSYMDRQDETTLQQLMQTPPRQVFEESGYRPR